MEKSPKYLLILTLLGAEIKIIDDRPEDLSSSFALFKKVVIDLGSELARTEGPRVVAMQSRAVQCLGRAYSFLLGMEESGQTLADKHLKILDLMTAELHHADTKYADDRMSPEEISASYLTLLCEVTELEREVARIKKRMQAMHKEAVQCLAMTFKFLRDVVFADME
jgi:hypothetical protein